MGSEEAANVEGCGSEPKAQEVISTADQGVKP
jgi:hypothetical protein